MRRARSPLVVLLAVLAGAPAAAQVDVTVQLDARNRYLFAGMPFAQSGVITSQVNVSALGGYLNAYAYGVYDQKAREITEGDIWGDYYVQASDLVGVFAGAALYNFKIAGEWEPTFELYGGVVLGLPLSPTLYVAHDFDLTEGTHATLGVSHALGLGGSGLSLDLAGTVDYNDGYYADEYFGAGAGWSYTNVGASVGIPVGRLTVTPFGLLQWALMDELTDEEVYGLRISASF